MKRFVYHFGIYLCAIFLLTVAAATLLSCSTTGTEPSGDAIPLWARQSTRTVDNGYIVYVESDDDPSEDVAKFKSESAALADLENECTLIPKGVRVEDRYEHKVAHLYQAYAKAAVEMQLCDQAKKTLTPETVRALANVPMTEQVKRYQEKIGQTTEVIALADSGNPDQAPGAGGVSNSDGGSPLSPPPPPGQILVRDDEHFFVIREEIVYAKQDVVLAPATAYQPQSPEYVKFTQNVPVQTESVTHYAVAHPQLQSSNHAWSFYRHTILRPRINTNGQEVRPIGQKPSQPAATPKAERRPQRRRRTEEGQPQ